MFESSSSIRETFSFGQPPTFDRGLVAVDLALGVVGVQVLVLAVFLGNDPRGFEPGLLVLVAQELEDVQ